MAKNVIIMIGDGMGWEMARAAAIQEQITQGKTGATLTDFYVEGRGTGLSFQDLDGYTPHSALQLETRINYSEDKG